VGGAILDVGCGYGRIALPLARRGYQVTGIDNSAALIAAARADAVAERENVDYLVGDMRHLGWHEQFDLVVSWMAAFGYYDDDTNRDVLRQFADCLKPGGALVMQTMSAEGVAASWQKYTVVERGDDVCIDRSDVDVDTGRLNVARTIVRNGKTRRLSYFVRLLTVAEAEEWLRDAGFDDIEITVARRDVWMTVVARRPV
jgi:SAM-dependent methyltransferase